MPDDSEDSFLVNTLCKEVLEIGELEVEGITRLGRRKENHNRPIRVTLKSTMDKRKLMASAYKLKDAKGEFKDISITYDLNKEEREETRKLVAQAKERTAADKSGTIYKVRGPPWALRIQQITVRHQKGSQYPRAKRRQGSAVKTKIRTPLNVL